jgi:SAM-dependent methyltransferase
MSDQTTSFPSAELSNELPEYVRQSRLFWDGEAPQYVKDGRSNYARSEPVWGAYSIVESQLHVLPSDVAGLDVIELGCGTGYVSAWLARRGARPVGIDNSPEQLRTARALQKEFALDFPLILGNAESTGLPDANFDLAISEYGAAIWCDPYRWIPEAARLLRPGGRLIFLGSSTLLMLCMPDEYGKAAEDKLVRPQAGMHRFVWRDIPLALFYLSHGDWIRLLRKNGFAVEDLVEIYPPEDAKTRFPFFSLEWARRWPCEELWKARKLG